MKKNRKKDPFAEENEEEGMYAKIPLHRSYGVKKKESILDKVLEKFFMIMMTVLFIALASVAVVVLVMMLLYAPNAIRFLLIFVLAVVVLLAPLRIFWKRLQFVRRLKRFARRNRFKLKFLRSFFAAFRHNGEKADFMISTGKHVYYGCYLNVFRHCYVTFSAPGKILITTNISNNKFLAVYGMKFRMKEKSFVFPTLPETAGAKTIPVILCNPMPFELYRIEKDGARVGSGTGDVVFGCHVHSANAFLHAVERKERE